MQEHMIAGADGIRTYVADHPAMGDETGPPVLCLHGLTRNGKDFRDLVGPLQALGRRVLVVDVRGRGRSDRDPNPANYHPGTYVQDVLAILAALSVPRAVFIGTSMGGLITVVTAMLAPQVVAGAVLNDVGPEIDPAGLARIQGYVGETRPVANWDEAATMIQRIGESAFPGRDHAFWRDFATRTCIETPDGIAFDYDPAISAITRATPATQVPAMWDQWRLLAGIPEASIRGALSDLFAEATQARMKDEKPDLIVAVVPGVGHAPQLTEPEAWEAIVALVGRTA